MPPERIRLTEARVRAIPPSTTGKPAWVHDTEVKNLYLSVSPKGLRTFYGVVFVKGQTVKTRLGTWPDLTVEIARKRAQGIASDTARRKEVTATLERIDTDENRTVGELFRYWHETHSKMRKRTWREDQRDYDNVIRPLFHDMPVSNLRRADVERMIASTVETAGKGPARKGRAILSSMFGKAIEMDWVDANPVRGTFRPEYDPRQRYLKPDEIGAFFRAVDQLESDLARDFFLLCLWTGARRSNVASMQWSELDLIAKTWTIPKSKHKGKKSQTIPLSDEAMAIINRRKLSGHPEWVLPGRGKAGHYSWPKDAWKRVLSLSGLNDVRIHDLRRSMGAWQQQAGDNLKLISQTLGHSTVEVTSRFYTPTEIEPIRKSVNQVAKAMRDAASSGE